MNRIRFRLGTTLLLTCAGLCLAQAPAEPAPAAPAPAVQEGGAGAKPEDVKADVRKADAKVVKPETAQQARTAAEPAKAAAEVSAPPARTDPTLEPPPARRTPAPVVDKGKTGMPGGPGGNPGGSDDKPYVIGPLDVLYVRVWNNQNLTGMVDVRPDGMINLALIGEIKADGLTIPQLRDELKTRLNDFFISPEVDVQLTKVNSKKFLILGEVGHPGEYPLVGRTTILEALTSAGGFRDTANQKKIYLLRGKVKHYFNYKDALEGKNPDQDIPIENGDRIVVPQ